MKGGGGEGSQLARAAFVDEDGDSDSALLSWRTGKEGVALVRAPSHIAVLMVTKGTRSRSDFWQQIPAICRLGCRTEHVSKTKAEENCKMPPPPLYQLLLFFGCFV